MKKLVLVAAALFLLSPAACSDSAAPAQAAGDAQTGIVMLLPFFLHRFQLP